MCLRYKGTVTRDMARGGPSWEDARIGRQHGSQPGTNSMMLVRWAKSSTIESKVSGKGGPGSSQSVVELRKLRAELTPISIPRLQQTVRHSEPGEM